MVKKRIGRTVWLMLLMLNLAVIWGNSLLDGEQSSAISGWVGQWLSRLLGSDEVVSGGSGHGLLRKLGHITEFFSLGIVVSQLAAAFAQPPHRSAWIALAGGIFTACVDEFIQRFVPGRSGRLMDVGIDAIGIVLSVVLIYCIEKKKMKISGGNSK